MSGRPSTPAYVLQEHDLDTKSPETRQKFRDVVQRALSNLYRARIAPNVGPGVYEWWIMQNPWEFAQQARHLLLKPIDRERWVVLDVGCAGLQRAVTLATLVPLDKYCVYVPSGALEHTRSVLSECLAEIRAFAGGIHGHDNHRFEALAQRLESVIVLREVSTNFPERLRPSAAAAAEMVWRQIREDFATTDRDGSSAPITVIWANMRDTASYCERIRNDHKIISEDKAVGFLFSGHAHETLAKQMPWLKRGNPNLLPTLSKDGVTEQAIELWTTPLTSDFMFQASTHHDQFPAGVRQLLLMQTVGQVAANLILSANRCLVSGSSFFELYAVGNHQRWIVGPDVEFETAFRVMLRSKIDRTVGDNPLETQLRAFDHSDAYATVLSTNEIRLVNQFRGVELSTYRQLAVPTMFLNYPSDWDVNEIDRQNEWTGRTAALFSSAYYAPLVRALTLCMSTKREWGSIIWLGDSYSTFSQFLAAQQLQQWETQKPARMALVHVVTASELEASVARAVAFNASQCPAVLTNITRQPTILTALPSNISVSQELRVLQEYVLLNSALTQITADMRTIVDHMMVHAVEPQPRARRQKIMSAGVVFFFNNSCFAPPHRFLPTLAVMEWLGRHGHGSGHTVLALACDVFDEPEDPTSLKNWKNFISDSKYEEVGVQREGMAARDQVEGAAGLSGGDSRSRWAPVVKLATAGMSAEALFQLPPVLLHMEGGAQEREVLSGFAVYILEPDSEFFTEETFPSAVSQPSQAEFEDPLIETRLPKRIQSHESEGVRVNVSHFRSQLEVIDPTPNLCFFWPVALASGCTTLSQSKLNFLRKLLERRTKMTRELIKTQPYIMASHRTGQLRRLEQAHSAAEASLNLLRSHLSMPEVHHPLAIDGTPENVERIQAEVARTEMPADDPSYAAKLGSITLLLLKPVVDLLHDICQNAVSYIAGHAHPRAAQDVVQSEDFRRNFSALTVAQSRLEAMAKELAATQEELQGVTLDDYAKAIYTPVVLDLHSVLKYQLELIEESKQPGQPNLQHAVAQMRKACLHFKESVAKKGTRLGSDLHSAQNRLKYFWDFVKTQVPGIFRTLTHRRELLRYSEESVPSPSAIDARLEQVGIQHLMRLSEERMHLLHNARWAYLEGVVYSYEHLARQNHSVSSGMSARLLLDRAPEFSRQLAGLRLEQFLNDNAPVTVRQAVLASVETTPVVSEERFVNRFQWKKWHNVLISPKKVVAEVSQEGGGESSSSASASAAPSISNPVRRSRVVHSTINSNVLQRYLEDSPEGAPLTVHELGGAERFGGPQGQGVFDTAAEANRAARGSDASHRRQMWEIELPDAVFQYIGRLIVDSPEVGGEIQLEYPVDYPGLVRWLDAPIGGAISSSSDGEDAEETQFTRVDMAMKHLEEGRKLLCFGISEVDQLQSELDRKAVLPSEGLSAAEILEQEREFRQEARELRRRRQEIVTVSSVSELLDKLLEHLRETYDQETYESLTVGADRDSARSWLSAIQHSLAPGGACHEMAMEFAVASTLHTFAQVGGAPLLQVWRGLQEALPEWWKRQKQYALEPLWLDGTPAYFQHAWGMCMRPDGVDLSVSASKSPDRLLNELKAALFSNLSADSVGAVIVGREMYNTAVSTNRMCGRLVLKKALEMVNFMVFRMIDALPTTPETLSASAAGEGLPEPSSNYDSRLVLSASLAWQEWIRGINTTTGVLSAVTISDELLVVTHTISAIRDKVPLYALENIIALTQEIFQALGPLVYSAATRRVLKTLEVLDDGWQMRWNHEGFARCYVAGVLNLVQWSLWNNVNPLYCGPKVESRHLITASMLQVLADQTIGAMEQFSFPELVAFWASESDSDLWHSCSSLLGYRLQQHEGVGHKAGWHTMGNQQTREEFEAFEPTALHVAAVDVDELRDFHHRPEAWRRGRQYPDRLCPRSGDSGAAREALLAPETLAQLRAIRNSASSHELLEGDEVVAEAYRQEAQIRPVEPEAEIQADVEAEVEAEVEAAAQVETDERPVGLVPESVVEDMMVQEGTSVMHDVPVVVEETIVPQEVVVAEIAPLIVAEPAPRAPSRLIAPGNMMFIVPRVFMPGQPSSVPPAPPTVFMTPAPPAGPRVLIPRRKAPIATPQLSSLRAPFTPSPTTSLIPPAHHQHPTIELAMPPELPPCDDFGTVNIASVVDGVRNGRDPNEVAQEVERCLTQDLSLLNSIASGELGADFLQRAQSDISNPEVMEGLSRTASLEYFLW